jgi:hypothetical protein
VIRHRLDRGGDRQINCALHMIALTRIRLDPASRAYVQRRKAEGKAPEKRSDASSATSPAWSGNTYAATTSPATRCRGRNAEIANPP